MSEEIVTHREPGFYWVKLGRNWRVAEWVTERDLFYIPHWFSNGAITSDDWWDEIQESRLFSPDEQSGDGTHPNQWGPMT